MDKVELNSQPLDDTQDQRSQMAMNNPRTRAQFEAREIEQPAPSTEEITNTNKIVNNTLQNQLRAMTVTGRKAQREKLRRQMATPTPAAPGVRDPLPARETDPEDEVIDKIYTIGSHYRAK